ncbi:hypothetical protein HDU97_008928 [Phlyctochytrium planicorne]|nr:hypothetical protein HDU97_008928 [Phlyctochytrium planicorne]
MVYDVNGKVALITGSASGFGLALAERLASKGSKIVASDVNQKDGQAAVDALNSKYGKGTATFVRCDVSKPEELEALFKNGVKTFGRLDIVVNNAGIGENPKFFDEPGMKWKKVIDINFTAVVHGTDLAISQFLKQTPVTTTPRPSTVGVIVNTASLSGFLPSWTIPLYGATKHGVVGLTRSLGHPFYNDTGIRVNAVAPAFVLTGLTKAMFDGDGDSSTQEVFKKVGTIPVETVIDSFISTIEDEDKAGKSLLLVFDLAAEGITQGVVLKITTKGTEAVAGAGAFMAKKKLAKL